MGKKLDRREFIAGTAAGVGAVATGSTAHSQSRANRGMAPPGSLAATPPAGFQLFSAPGKVVRVDQAGSLRPGNVFPKADAATAMVNKAVMELTGQGDLAAAWRKIVHPQDRVG